MITLHSLISIFMFIISIDLFIYYLNIIIFVRPSIRSWLGNIFYLITSFQNFFMFYIFLRIHFTIIYILLKLNNNF